MAILLCQQCKISWKNSKKPDDHHQVAGLQRFMQGGLRYRWAHHHHRSAATAIRGAAIIHAIDIGLLQARCDAHLARHQVARGQTVHADGAHVLSHLPLGSRLRTTAVDGSAEDAEVVNLLIAIVSKMYFLLTSCFFKSSKYGVIFIHGPLWAQIRDSRGMVFSRSLTSGVKPFYLSAHDCPVIAKWSVNKCNDGD